MGTVADVLDWCQRWDGQEEGEGNANPFALMCGFPDHQPWCGSFALAALTSCAVPLPAGARSPYTPSIFAAFRREGRTHDAPQPGDLGFVFYRSMARIGHVFLVRDVAADHVVITWEGNTNQAASASGGQVASLARDWVAGRHDEDAGAYVYGFARPDYGSTSVGMLPNVPVRADHTGQLVIPAAWSRRAIPAAELVEDGVLGPATIRAWQVERGTTVDGAISRPSKLVAAVQRQLNVAVDARLVVDGLGIAQDGHRYTTVAALQGWLGTPRDGVLSPGHSVAVEALQRRLNAALASPSRAA